MITDPHQQAKEAQLRYVADSIPGLKRRKTAKDFNFFDPEGIPIKDEKVLERIYNLVIPPAWKDVWISPVKNSHLQVTGFDEKGRKQYIYHPEWTRLCQENKFSKMGDFGLSLPKIRSRVRYDLDRKEPDFKRVVATVVWLLEHTLIRVGNDEYARDNKSFGLTTLRNKHVDITGDEMMFEFIGKSGVKHRVKVSNPKIRKSVQQCFELPGFQLFQYIDESGDQRVIDSSDVNQYLKDTTGEEITAKDFRTWGGTLLSAVTLKNIGDFDNSDSLKKNVQQACKTVASHLRNTVSVCRSYYIHPAVINSYSVKKLIPHFNKFNSSEVNGLGLNEFRVLNLIK